MFCIRCGTYIFDGESFCLQCGTPKEETLTYMASTAKAAAPYQQAGVLQPAQPGAVLYQQPGALQFAQSGSPQHAQPGTFPYEEPVAPFYPQPGTSPYAQPVAPSYPQPGTPLAKKKSKKGLFIAIGAVAVVAIVAVAVVLVLGGLKTKNYNKALELFDAGNYWEAYKAFEELGDYQDAAAKAVLSLQYYDFERAVGLYEEGLYDQAIILLTRLANEGFTKAEEYLRLIAEKQIRESLNEKLKQFSDPASYLWQAWVQDALKELEGLGINSKDLIAAWTDGFSYEIGKITVKGNNATVEVTITCKQLFPALSTAMDKLFNEPGFATMTEAQMFKRYGELVVAELRSSKPKTTKLTIPYKKVGIIWMEDVGAEDEFERAIMG